MKERIVIIFIAVTLGLILTTFGFFLYESTKPANNNTPTPSPISSSQPQTDELLLVVDEPNDELVTEKRTISVRGKTDPENTVIISTNQEDTVAKPTSNGSFSTTISIDTGINKVVIKAIAPDGKQRDMIRTVSFSPEDF